MKILSLTAENIKKLKVVTIKPSVAIVEITGANGSGKSSVLDAIYYALAGTKDIPSQPIRSGQKTAVVKLDLGEITVTRKFSADTESGTSLVVEARNGARFSSPQKMLDELLGKLTFDPLAFSRMEPKQQLEQIRSIVTLDEDIDTLDAANDADFDKRTQLNREIKSLDARAAGLVIPDGTPDEEISITALVDELEQLGETNRGIEQDRASRRRVAGEIETQRREVTRLLKEAERLREQASQIEKNVLRLEAQADGLSNEADTFAENLAEITPTIEPEIKDGTEIKKKIEAARVTNSNVIGKKNRDGIWEHAKNLRQQVEDLVQAMQVRVFRKNQAIAAAKMPIDGLSFGDGEVIMNGLPLNQASSAEQLRVSVAVAMAANPKLKVLRIKDGSLLDHAGMEILRTMVGAADYQVWIERVDSSGKVGIVMEDGEVKS